MKNRIVLIILLLHLCSQSHAQNFDYRNNIIDTVLEKVKGLLYLDVPMQTGGYLTEIRIIDLTKKYTSWPIPELGIKKSKGGGGYFRKVPYIIREGPIPFNLNSGVYRDVVFLDQKKRRGWIKLRVSVCHYQSSFGIHKCLILYFIFDLKKENVFLKEFKVLSDE